jgi:hypothetical protein
VLVGVVARAGAITANTARRPPYTRSTRRTKFHVVAIVFSPSHRFLNHLVWMVVVEAILPLYAVGKTNCLPYMEDHPHHKNNN